MDEINVSQEEIDALIRAMSGPRTRAPTGFDAKTTREEFINKAKAHPVTAEDEPVLLPPMKYYGKCQPEQDLLMFISLFLKYGNNTQAWRELKNSPIISRKCALYGIDTQTKGKNLRRNQITLSRIARAFPIHTAFVAMKNKAEGILPYSSFFINKKLPLIMQHSFFPGLIPVNKFTEELRSVTLILNMEISKILKQESRSIPFLRRNNRLICTFDDDIDTLEQLIASSAKYVDAGINNGIDDDKKLKILTKAEILVPNADGELELSAATVALVNKLEKIKECYSLTFADAIEKLYLEEKSEGVEDTVAEE